MVRTIHAEQLKDFSHFKNQMNQDIFAHVSESVFAMMTEQLLIPLMQIDVEIPTDIDTEKTPS